MSNTDFSGTLDRSERVREDELLDLVCKNLCGILPSDWHVHATSLHPRKDGSRLDAVLTIADPYGVSAQIGIGIKREIPPSHVRTVSEQVAASNDYAYALVLCPFLSLRTRDLLTEMGIGYADATGNVRIALQRPALFLSHAGANENPWSEHRPLLSLKGRAAGRVVRALCDFIPPYGVRQLAGKSQTPIASISRVAALLEREAFVMKSGTGTIENVLWSPLIHRWSHEYSLLAANTSQSFLAPRGIDDLVRNLHTLAMPYAVTGSLAGSQFAPTAPPRLATLYVENINAAAVHLHVRPADRGANVLLLKPFDPVAFERTTEIDGVIYASLSQVAVDLLSGSGRGPSEAEQLLQWMERNEHAWRK